MGVLIKELDADPLEQVPPVQGAIPPGIPDPAINPDAPLYNIGGGAEGSEYLFNRNWKLDLITPNQFGFLSTGNVLRSYKDLKMTFELEKNQNSKVNSGKISVYNLTDESRSLFLKDKKLIFSIGYGGALYPLFTDCAIDRVQHERKGADFVSTFEVTESGTAVLTTTVNKTYPAGTSRLKVVQDLVALMGLVTGTVDSAFLSTPYNSAFTASGLAMDVLRKVAAASQCTVIPPTAGGVINIVGKSQTVKPTEIPLSEKSGLIGIPNLGLAGGRDNILTFTALIDPRLKPNAVVRISSRFVQGLAMISTAKYEGDTHDSKWTVKCEARPLNPGSLTSAGTNTGAD